ncbi:MAG: arylsulfatase [Verrucomicrobiales bacterium]|nr:arylsulfatase [Verrucomicrobiales bacterium]|tara:strand:+ start:577 stop:1905 length:1329 start_codon:yes stop_codon:yes gene_type:complete
MLYRLIAVIIMFFQASNGIASDDQKYNVILIMADDSAVDNYGCYGSDYFKTPIIDQLAKTGIRFTHCYSEPVCTPSRVKIMTGRDGIRNYVQFGTLDRDEITFAHMLKKAGYTTAVAGKWQLHNGERGALAPESGFDTYCLWNYPGTRSSRYWNPSIMQNGKLLKTKTDDYGPDIFSKFLIEFIDSNKNRPFFIYYPMVLVHSPFPKTPDNKTANGKTAQGKDQSLPNFRDMTLYADKIVGRLVAALEKNNLRENTILIFTTDNGTNRKIIYPFQNETRKGEKAYATDGGSHVPLIVNCPGIVPAGKVSSDLVDFSDFLPSIADITKAKLPNVILDGQSFWPQCLGKKGNPRKWIFQYYYPKFKPAAETHGQGVNNLEIIWAQNQKYKLYRDGSFYSTADRHELSPIKNGENKESDHVRKILQEALNLMPAKAVKLSTKYQN